MNIVTIRRISQVFFFLLFIWFAIVNTVGDSFYQLRGWPVNLFLELDPLPAIATMLSTGTLYRGMAWALVTIILTILVGRFFCSWLCPFGTWHHFVGYLAHRKKKKSERIALNRYRKGQVIKYFILIVFLVAAFFPLERGSLLTGLLDPIPLFTRTVTLVVLPILDRLTHLTFQFDRYYQGAVIIMGLFMLFTFLNIIIPRFFCRFLCPAGALMGLLSRFTIFRIGQNSNTCHNCNDCEASCEGGCEPAGEIHQGECLLCFNCRQDCPHETISYQKEKSTAGEITGPEISRKAFLTTLGAGLFTVPVLRLNGLAGPAWPHDMIRPPGALDEEQFLERCIKCGQCMRVCPTNVIQPGTLAQGLETLWTPVLDFRTGSSGCQYNCVACSQSCPTAALRPLSLAEKQGTGNYKKAGPVKLGTAFFDRNRCLPWSMKTPCIVCQENCPVSPKAIYTDEVFEPVRDGLIDIEKIAGKHVTVRNRKLPADTLGTGDFFLQAGNNRYRVISNQEDSIECNTTLETPGEKTATIMVRLQRPYMDIDACIGCGICQHECPVEGLKAVRVSAEGESRSPGKKMIPR